MCYTPDQSLDSYRPMFHFTCRQGWLNDPVGLIFHDGTYHLFFQHTPDKSRPKDKECWGHATSRDFLNWKELPIAIPPQDGCPAFSGSTVIDHQNSTGLQKGDNPVFIAICTMWGKGQYLYYSNDLGMTWQCDDRNPVLTLPNDEIKTFADSARDPRIIWHEPTKKWVMILFQNRNGIKGNGFFTSENLIDWTFTSHLPGPYVCPDLFQLPLDGDRNRQEWVLLDWKHYFIGDFDGKIFSPETEQLCLDAGDYFASNQTWFDGRRRVQIAWLWDEKNKDRFPGQPFDQQMTIPCELSLGSTSDGPRLKRIPAEELRQFRKRTDQLQNLNSFDIEMNLPQTDFQCQIHGRNYQYDARKHLLTSPENKLFFPDSIQNPTVRFIVDKTSVEIFANDGFSTLTEPVYPTNEKQGIQFKTDGRSPFPDWIQVYTLRHPGECAP